MKEDKKIENLFKDNQHKLDEMPSPMAWDRLEGRLDERDTRRKGFTLRRLAVAAAVFIAVSMLALWTVINPLGNGMNQTAELFSKNQLASEIISSDAPAPARPILMSHREKSQYLTDLSNTRINTQPVLAENKSKAYNVRPPKPVEKPLSSTPPKKEIALVLVTPDVTIGVISEPVLEEQIVVVEAEKEVVVMEYKNVSEDDLLENEIVEVAENQQIVTAPTTTSAAYAYDVEMEKVERTMSEEMPDEGIAFEEVAVSKDSSTKRADKKRERKAKNTGKIAATRASSPTPSAAIVIAESEMAAEVEPELDRFDWLLGKWADEDDNSFEEWQRIAPNILEGKGYFVVDVDTTFTQSMKIVQSNQKVYFMVNGQLVEGRYELKEYDDRSATFKNQAQQNEQITLKKDANDKLTVTVEKNKRQTAKDKKKNKRTLKRVKEDD